MRRGVGASFIACTETVSGWRSPIAILLWGDYSRFAMGARRRKTFGASDTTVIETSATPMPAITSSRKWLAVAITQNHTQTGQRAQKILAHQCLQTEKSTTPTISESAACRLGIAAYGLLASEMRAEPWLRPLIESSASPKPKLPNIRGGAVGLK